MISTYRAAYEAAKQTLLSAGVTDASVDAKQLMAHCCGISFSDLYAHGERELPEEKQAVLNEAVKKRALRIPLAYITGMQGFMGEDFLVRPGVLVPRPDTETLVEEAMPHLFDGMRLLDLCTGSGCVGLSLLRYSNETSAVMTDLSEEAVHCAEENAERLSLSSRVKVVACDLFPPGDCRPEKGFDLVTANPPYIRTDVIETLEDEVRVHEPRMALDGGPDGLSFYRRIVPGARGWLTRGGRLLTEIGHDQADAVRLLFEEAGYRHIAVADDAGNRRRVVGAVYIP